MFARSHTTSSFQWAVCGWLALTLMISPGCGHRAGLRDRVLEAGDKLFAAKDYETAAKVYQKALSYDPAWAPTYSRIAAAELLRGNIRGAARAACRAAELAHGDEETAQLCVELAFWSASPPAPSGTLAELKDWVGKLEQHLPGTAVLNYAKGRAAWLEGDLARASEYFTAAAGQGQSPRYVRWLILALCAQGEFERATRWATLAGGNSGFGLEERFWLLVHRGSWQQALELLHQHCWPPGEKTCWPRLVLTYEAVGNRDRATALLEEAARIPALMGLAAELALRTGRDAQALEWFQRAWQNDPQPEWRAGWVQALMAGGQFDRAKAELAHWHQQNDRDPYLVTLQLLGAMLSKMNPADVQKLIASPGLAARVPHFHFYAGEFLSWSGQPVLALERYQRARELAPDLLPAWEAELNLRLELRAASEAWAAAERYLQRFPWREGGILAASTAAIDLGYRERAESGLAAIRDRSLQADRQWQRARLRYRLGNLEAARSVLPATGVTDPLNACRVLVARAEALFSQQRHKEAARLLGAALESQPGCLEAKRLQLEALLHSREAGEAFAEATRVLEQYPQATEFRLLRAQAAWMRGDRGQAERDLQAALAQPAGSATAQFSLGLLALERGDYRKAREHFRAVLVADPGHVPAMNNLAFVLAELGEDLDEARAYAERAVAAQPASPAYADTLGWVCVQQGELGEATRWLEQAARAIPASALYRYHLGVALARAGSVDRARHEWQQALSLNPPASLRHRIQQALGASAGLR